MSGHERPGQDLTGARYLHDGSLAGLAGSAQSVDRSATPFTLVRLHRDGSLDKSFGTDGVVSTTVSGSGSGARAAVAQADGKILAAGLVFFQVQTGGPPRILDLRWRVAALLVGVGLAVTLVFLLPRRRSVLG